MRIEINHDAVAALLKSPEVLADLEARGQRIAAAASGAGSGTFKVDSGIGATRARVTVITADFAARQDEATRRTLTSALDAGR